MVLADVLKGSYCGFYDKTCCVPTSYPTFRNMLDDEDPELTPHKCIQSSEEMPLCLECGTKKKFNDTFSCPVFENCKEKISTFVFMDAPRSGVDVAGNARTQEELLPMDLEFNDVAKLLVEPSDKKGRKHFVNTIWANCAMKNLPLKDDDGYAHIQIDFGATMDLQPLLKMNCHKNAHCVDLVMIFHINSRWVEVKGNDGATIEHCINGTIAVHSFAEMTSKGKKTDAWMIRWSLEEALVVLVSHLREKNVTLKGICIGSDNCANQNKCCHCFWHLAALSETLAPHLHVAELKRKQRKEQETQQQMDVDQQSTEDEESQQQMDVDETMEEAECAICDLDHTSVEGMKGCHAIEKIVEKFGHILPEDWMSTVMFDVRQQCAEQGQCKGEHDSESGVTKHLVVHDELAMKRCPNGKGVFTPCTLKLGSKTGLKLVAVHLPEMERKKDEQLLNFHKGTISMRLHLHFSEDQEVVTTLRNEGHQHVHCIERDTPTATTSTVPSTTAFREIHLPKPDISGENRVTGSSTLSCSCQPCMKEFDSDDCECKHMRSVSEHFVKPSDSESAPISRRTLRVTSDEMMRTAEKEMASDDRVLQMLQLQAGKSTVAKSDLNKIAQRFNLSSAPAKSVLKAEWIKCI